jgi:hypothetical protein
MVTTTTENAFAGKYEINQATSTSNSCLNPLFDSSTFEIVSNIGNCGNTVSQQAEGGQASSPITLQIADPTIEVQAPAEPEPPEPQTCEECLTEFLSEAEIVALQDEVEFTLETICSLLEIELVSLGALEDVLNTIGVEEGTIQEVIECLERVFGLDM